MDNKLGHARGLNSIVFTKCKSAKLFLKVGLGGVNISGRYWRVGSISHWTLSWQNCRNLWQDGLRSREDGGGWVLIELRMSVFGSFIRLFCKTLDPNVSNLCIFFPCSRVLLHSDNGGFLVLSCWWRLGPQQALAHFFEEHLQRQVTQHYWSLAISYRGLGTLNGVYQSRALDIPFGLQRDELIIFKNKPISQSRSLMFAKKWLFHKSPDRLICTLHTFANLLAQMLTIFSQFLITFACQNFHIGL